MPMMFNPNTVLDALSRVADLAKKANHVELLEQVMNLREAIVTLREDNVRLREENTALQQQVAARITMHFDGLVYWTKEGGVFPSNGPYCPHCRDAGQKDMRLHQCTGLPWLWRCDACKTTYGTNHGYRQPEVIRG